MEQLRSSVLLDPTTGSGYLLDPDLLPAVFGVLYLIYIGMMQSEYEPSLTVLLNLLAESIPKSRVLPSSSDYSVTASTSCSNTALSWWRLPKFKDFTFG